MNAKAKKLEQKRLLDTYKKHYLDHCYKHCEEIHQMLLYDHNTKKSLIFANHQFEEIDTEFTFSAEIPLSFAMKPPSVIDHTGTFAPSFFKSQQEKTGRCKKNAEVTTPAWVINKMNSLIDNVCWSGDESINPFNKQEHLAKEWATTKTPIPFPCKRFATWQEYVGALRIEFTCGEAPYIVSRYCCQTGRPIPTKERVGFLDRKLRVVTENTQTREEWRLATHIAVRSCYGYEYQGDNLYLGRQNILNSVVDYHIDLFDEMPGQDYLLELAYSISWNFFQMDGIKYVLPGSDFSDIYIFDWANDKPVKYVSLLNNHSSQQTKSS